MSFEDTHANHNHNVNHHNHNNDDNTDDDDDDQIQEDNYYNLQFVVESSSVKLYTSSTKLNALIRKQEARTMHLLNSKGIKYELIFVDLQEDQQKEMLDLSGSSGLPQLHVGGKYFGDFVLLQEMEDRGELDKIFESVGMRARPKFMRIGSEAAGSGKMLETKNGILTATASKRFIQLTWEEGRAMFAGNGEVQWMLSMDAEPVYLGTDTHYLVNNPTPEPHQFDVRVMQSPNDVTSSSSEPKSLGEVRIATPLEDGVLTAKVTVEFIHLSWNDGAHLLNGGNWLLLMNREPVYLGKDAEYVVTTPTTGTHLFSLRLTNSNGKDITDKIKQRLGELIISAPKTSTPPVVDNRFPNKKSIASVVAMFDHRTQHDTSQTSQTMSSASSADNFDQLQTEQSIAYVAMLNEKDRQLAVLSRKLEQERHDRGAVEAALGILRPTARISSHERNLTMLSRIESLTEAAKGFASAKEGVGQLQQEVESLRSQNFNLMAIELKSRDLELATLRNELECAVQQLKTAEATLDKICEQLELPPASEAKAVRDSVYDLQKERQQFLHRATVAERDNVGLRKVRGVMEEGLAKLIQKVENMAIDVEYERRKVKAVEMERETLKRKLQVFEESHVVMMKQVEAMTQSVNDQEEKGVLGLAISRMRSSIGMSDKANSSSGSGPNTPTPTHTPTVTNNANTNTTTTSAITQ
eukprot:c18190_g1_i1.p1 GENE.c18190_g1_i1~~c18190_g1_i1.p1  ORF type:complete len:696 (-),score=225.97 c18190_g1_i1:35-2122(-)